MRDYGQRRGNKIGTGSTIGNARISSHAPIDRVPRASAMLASETRSLLTVRACSARSSARLRGACCSRSRVLSVSEAGSTTPRRRVLQNNLQPPLPVPGRSPARLRTVRPQTPTLKMDPEDEINQWLPPAYGNDDGPNKMPAAD